LKNISQMLLNLVPDLVLIQEILAKEYQLIRK
jgi:hypothetical protein